MAGSIARWIDCDRGWTETDTARDGSRGSRVRPPRRKLVPASQMGSITDFQRFGARPSAAVSIWPMRLGNLLVDASSAQFTQESLRLLQVKRV
jgi:hypothetical protein